MIWFELLICAALIITWAGSLLSKYGDVIADKTGWGRAWIGVILIAGMYIGSMVILYFLG